MLRIVLAAVPATVATTSAMAGTAQLPASPASGILGLVAAGVIAGVFMARRRK